LSYPKFVIYKRGISGDIRSTKEDFRVQYPSGTVDLDLDDRSGIAVLRINHPERRNALSGKMMADLNDKVGVLENWSSGRAVIFGAALTSPPSFCSGGDLRTMKGIVDERHEGGKRMCALMQDTMTRFRALPMISMAAVHGVAMGGGAELTLWCDFRGMTPTSSIAFVQGKMGVTTGWGGGAVLVRLVGRSQALAMLTGASKQSVDPQKALEIGLSNVTLPDVTEGVDAVELAKQWLLDNVLDLSVPVEVARAAKSVVHAGDHPQSLLRALEEEKELFSKVWSGEAQQAALSAFFKKK
jgi:ethylmalonyl-CoA/methylmalonyl-CoA decarboxylase